MQGIRRFICFPALAVLVLLWPQAQALANDSGGVASVPSFPFEFLMLGLCSVLAPLAMAGFTMLEAGLVRSRNTAATCLKGVAVFSITGIMFYVVGYDIMFAGGDSPGLRAPFEISPETGYPASHWFLHMAFTVISVFAISGVLAERIKFASFLAFIVLFAGIVYPLQGAWSWGDGWLGMKVGGFKDLAGSTVAHSAGGWAALTGALILGPRTGKYAVGGRVFPLPGANMPLAALGAMILWAGWFGFSGSTVLVVVGPNSLAPLASVVMNVQLAGAAGCLAAILFSILRFGKPDLTLVINGALAGLVSIAASVDIASSPAALATGAISGLLCCIAIPLFDKLQIDDVVGALSVHLVGGVWGTLAVAVFSTGDYLSQIAGIAVTGVFVSLASAMIWLALDRVLGLRSSVQDERNGLDRTEVGLEAYPDFEIRHRHS